MKEVSGKTKEEKGLDLPVFELDPNTRRGFTKVERTTGTMRWLSLLRRLL